MDFINKGGSYSVSNTGWQDLNSTRDPSTRHSSALNHLRESCTRRQSPMAFKRNNHPGDRYQALSQCQFHIYLKKSANSGAWQDCSCQKILISRTQDDGCCALLKQGQLVCLLKAFIILQSKLLNSRRTTSWIQALSPLSCLPSNLWPAMAVRALRGKLGKILVLLKLKSRLHVPVI